MTVTWGRNIVRTINKKTEIFLFDLYIHDTNKSLKNDSLTDWFWSSLIGVKSRIILNKNLRKKSKENMTGEEKYMEDYI